MTGAVATIRQTSTAVPEHVMTQADAKAAARAVLPLRAERMAAVLALFDGVGVERRHSVLPMEGFHAKRNMSETMSLYREHAVRLGRQVATDCLARAGVAPAEVDMVIAVSCTGVMLPSFDAYLANELGFRPDVRRLPITELGCSGGAAALAFARDFITAHPGSTVLVISVELPTLSFQRDDPSVANLISSALFGDGAAAVLLSGRGADSPGPGAVVLDAQSHLFPRTIEALGFDLEHDGFHVVLARELPGIVRSGVGALVSGLLARAGVDRETVSAFVLHPGGRRILEALEDVLALRPEQTRPSRDIMREYGNVSSATVLLVLHEWLTRHRPAPGSHAVLGAFGPGFTAELAVLRWT